MEKQKKVYLPLTEEQAVRLWLDARDAGDSSLMSTLSMALIKQEVELPTSDAELLLDFYSPWLVDQGLIASTDSPEKAKGKLLEFRQIH